MNKLIILCLCGSFALHANAYQVDGDKADKNKFDFYSLRSQVEKYQAGKASLADIKAALADLKKDGFQGITEPETLTAEQAKGMQVTAENTCGVVRIMGPAGMVTGFGITYSSSGGRASALASASAHCVSGFRPVAVDSNK
jgi:hypothetical protein